MAKKTKDPELETKVTKKTATSDSKKSTKKGTTAKKSATSKAKTSAKKITTNTTKTGKKDTSKSSTAKVAKSTTKKSSDSKTKKSTTKKSTAKTTNSSKAKQTLFQSEYYDLPQNYNKTVVKVLAQTPTTLFVYWEISEEDRKKFQKTYGENFFQITKPILILYNDTLNYSSEIEINDFANSWYIHINDSKCDYHVELGRKPLPVSNAEKNISTEQNQSAYIPYYVYVISSNEMEAPNDKILFEDNKKIKFKNIKTGAIKEREIKEFIFITNYGAENIAELYKHLYPNENFKYENFLKNPSSGSFSSQFK